MLTRKQVEYDQCLRNWLNVAYDSLVLVSGRLLGRNDWVQGSTLSAYFRFQYKHTHEGVQFCIVLANINSSEPGGLRLVMEALKEFSERKGVGVYIENVLNKRVAHVAEDYAMQCFDGHDLMSAPCYYRKF